MTGYPSIPNAASAIRLGASDYVTKPFTPEEISQAVHRLLQHDEAGRCDAAGRGRCTRRSGFRFYHETWYQAGGEGAVRAGAILVRPGAVEDRIGPPAAHRRGGLPGVAAGRRDGRRSAAADVPAPLSGVVVAVNEALAADPAALLTDPCGQGWIACISPTRLEEEAGKCRPRRVVLLSRDRRRPKSQAEKLRWLGCDVRAIADPWSRALARQIRRATC